MTCLKLLPLTDTTLTAYQSLVNHSFPPTASRIIFYRSNKANNNHKNRQCNYKNKLLLSQTELNQLNNQQVGNKLIFLAADIRHHPVSWINTTSDPVVLDIVSQGLKNNFGNNILCKGAFLPKKIENLLKKNTISACNINYSINSLRDIDI